MARPTRFDITQTAAGHSLTVALSGELDLNTVEMLSEHLDSQLGGEITTVTLDLRELAFMDSSGLRLLIELNDRSKSEPWQLALLAPKAEAASVVLRVTGADARLPFEAASDA
jgi:stage II sporulation protein AA (anti-sigma F factor antagonist)